MTGHRSLVRVFAALLLVSLLAGCGAAAEPGRGTVTIPSKFGTARIDGPPERVVALDTAAADTTIALGVIPVGMAASPFVDGGVEPWRADALRGKPAPTLIETEPEIAIEQVAALRPDLILATNTFFLDRDAFDKLSRLAPVVGFEQAPLADDWRTAALRVGRALGREAQARTLVADAQRTFQASAPARFDGRTVNVFLASDQGVGVVTDPQDTIVRALAELGLRLDPAVQRLRGQGGRVVLSDERLDLLDADLLLGSGVTADALRRVERDPLFRAVDVVRSGRYVGIDYAALRALTPASPVSLRWAARELVPRLAAAG